ncbi:MAG: thiaminase II [Chlamydiales bacterium]|nr:thiaminase II [Chlamydiales bacterium]
MTFSSDLWQQTFPIYQRIINHPFNRELAEGTLERSRFLFYMEQDAYYLKSFSRALALIAGRASSSEMIHQFLNFALGALVAERELHAKFLAPNYTCDTIEPSVFCMSYTHYLISTASTASLEEAIAAVLPCFWIYREVGRHIAAYAKEENPYMLWIETYSSQEFSRGTDLAISILDKTASKCSVNTLESMKNAFMYSSLLEWHFWNDAYNKSTFLEAHHLIKF